MRAAIYARVSTTDQARTGTSLDTQLDRCRAFIESKGWALVDDYTDDGVSGAKARRPELDRVMAACRSGEIDVIVVAKLDRFGRNLRHLVTRFEELDGLGVHFASVAESIDSSTSSGRMLRNLLSTFAEFERDRITERMVDGLRRTAALGFWPGGPAPFGYRLIDDPAGSKHRVLAIADRHSEALRRAFQLVVNDGLTVYAAAPILNAEGFVTQRGRPWRHENLCFQLRKSHLTGTWVYKQGDHPIEVQIPAIFTVDEWNRLQSAIKGKPRPQRQNRRYPLTGRGRVHLRCSCGGNLYGKRDSGKKGRAYYECSRNKKEFGDERCEFRPRIIQAVHLEELVWNEVVAILTDPDYLHALAAEVIDDMTSDDGDPVRDLNRRLDALRDERTAIVREKARSNHLDALGDALAQVDVEEATLKQQLAHAERRQRLRTQRASVGQQIDAFVETARERIAHPTVELMAQVFDLLDIDLVRIADHQFEGTGSIPIPEDGGDVWKEGPRPY